MALEVKDVTPGGGLVPVLSTGQKALLCLTAAEIMLAGEKGRLPAVVLLQLPVPG